MDACSCRRWQWRAVRPNNIVHEAKHVGALGQQCCSKHAGSPFGHAATLQEPQQGGLAAAGGRGPASEPVRSPKVSQEHVAVGGPACSNSPRQPRTCCRAVSDTSSSKRVGARVARALRRISPCQASLARKQQRSVASARLVPSCKQARSVGAAHGLSHMLPSKRAGSQRSLWRCDPSA